MTKTRIGIIAVVVAIGVGGITWVIAQGAGEEDRPAMIVRNGSVIFTNNAATTGGQPLGWLYAAGVTFTPDQSNGKPVLNADAAVYKDRQGQQQEVITCELKAGSRFTIRYREGADTEEIHVITNGPRPLVFPNDLLSRSTDRKQLKRGSGNGAILVWMNNDRTTTCAVPTNHELRITFNHPPSTR